MLSGLAQGSLELSEAVTDPAITFSCVTAGSYSGKASPAASLPHSYVLSSKSTGILRAAL